MTPEQFQQLLDDTIERVRRILEIKASEYAPNEDRLRNFRTAAALQNCSVVEAIAAMMAKHTVSIYDMVESGQEYPIELWNEKIIDHLNYLVLLRAALLCNNGR